MGMDDAMVNVPHGLPLRAFTTKRARTPEQDLEDEEHGQGREEAGDRADLGLDHAREAHAVAARREGEDHHVLDGAHRARRRGRSRGSPGRKPNWAASVGPISGPGPAIQAKCMPKRVQRRNGIVVAVVAQPVGRGHPRIVEAAGRDRR